MDIRGVVEEGKDNTEVNTPTKKKEANEKCSVQSSVSSLASNLAAMTFSPTQLMFPHLVYDYEDSSGDGRCTVDVLLPTGTVNDQLDVRVKKGGKHLMISYTYPDIVLNAERLATASAGIVTGRDAKSVAMKRLVHELTDEAQDHKLVAMMKVPLPYKCEERILNQVGGTGVEVVLYEHDVADYKDAGQHYFMLHVELTNIKRSLKKAIIKKFRKVVGLTPSPTLRDVFGTNSGAAMVH